MVRYLRIWTLVALIIFLPLSAWLVSWTGNYLVSLGRDILFTLFCLLSLSNWRKIRRPDAIFWFGLIYILAALISYFVRQDSLSQWLRGFRYLTEPVILLMAISIFPIDDDARIKISWALLIALIIVLIASVIDHFVPALLRTSLHSGGRGFLGQIHFVGTNIPRLQATLAGPNALGLYLLVAILATPIWDRLVPKWLATIIVIVALISLVLTFSRSSYLGFFAGVIVLLALATRLSHRYRYYLAATLLAGLLLGGGVALLRPQTLNRLGSDETRLTQYQRVLQERSQIGLLGRGAGTAGLVSEYSFDNSPNYYSENTYLDIYENIGLFSVLAYIALWVCLLMKLIKKGGWLNLSAGSIVCGLLVAGLFIDHFTGQAAIWTITLLGGYQAYSSNGDKLRVSN